VSSVAAASLKRSGLEWKRGKKKMNNRILVIEDNSDMREFLKTLLEDNDYTVYVAKDYEEGLRLAAQEKPDLITLDLLLPDHTGFKLYRVLRTDRDLKDLPIIIITGVVTPDYPRIHLRKFFDEERAVRKPEEFLEKPIDEEELLAAVNRCVGYRRYSPSFSY